MSPTGVASQRLWSDWFYERVPLPPVACGVLLALSLLLLLAALAGLSGAFADLSAGGLEWWEVRDGRVGALLAVLAGTVPTALRFHELGTRRNLRALAEGGLWPGELPLELQSATRASPRTALLFGASGFLLIPLVAFSVDRDAGLYLTARYWGFGQIWTWVVGFFVTFTGGVLTYRVFVDARTFARLARELPAVDLLERDALVPFARQGLRSAVPGVIMVTFLALNLTDEGFLLAILLLGVLVLLQNGATLLIPVRGLHERLRAAKREELARVNAAIRGERGALDGSPIGAREAPSLADLLAWRQTVEAQSEWPIDFPTLGRFALYVGIPLLSWVGAALVERALDRAIG